MVTENKKQTPSSTRRSFLSRIWLGLGLVALLQFLAGSLFYVISGRKRSGTEEGQIVEAGAVVDFTPGSVTLIGRAHLYLVRLDDGGFLAISRKCTHLGCAVPWVAERNQFECPCHASIFDIKGNVVKSPATRALDLYPVAIERDMLRIDVSRPVRRSGFTAEQPVYAGERG